MSEISHALAVVVMLAGTASAITLFVKWMVALSDLLWMFSLRRALVGTVTVAIFTLGVVVVDRVFIGPHLSATAFLVAILATPLLARPLSNALAWHLYRRDRPKAVRLPEQAPRKMPPRWATFVFDLARGHIRDGYEAPPTVRD